MRTYDHEMMALLLIVLLGIAVSIGVVFLFLVLRWVHARQDTDSRNSTGNDSIDHLLRHTFKPYLGEHPIRWLAIRTTNTDIVLTALGLHNTESCSWEEGLARAHDRKLFVSPPLGEWVLVMGTELPDADEDIDDCFCFLQDLSLKLGQVQFFSANRILNHHTWARLENGRVQRAYAWIGETVWNQGRMTADEMELGMRCHPYTTPSDETRFSPLSGNPHNTEKVTLLAARWSVDPTAIDEQSWQRGRGIVGEFSEYLPD
jgi:hypothetical protein